ncbi:MAG: hydroxymethylbilane synthase [Verrucomicrobiota bacterium]
MAAQRVIRVATRGSRLALTQAGHVMHALQQAFPEQQFETTVVKTTGDKMQTGPLKAEGITKNIFTREIEEVLLHGGADMAVHSCKDLGVTMPAGLILAGSPPRRSPRDVLVVRSGAELEKEGAKILSGSVRRRLQWLEHFPTHQVLPIRGNIDTRIRKLQQDPSATALMLAQAGLDRLSPELGGCTVKALTVEEMIPAPGQGALALQCRIADDEMQHMIGSINDYVTFQSIQAERAFLAAMDAGCQEPLGALATPQRGGNLKMTAVYYYADDPRSAHRAEVTGVLDRPAEIAQKLALEFDRQSIN